MKTLKNKAEKSTANTKGVHEEKTAAILKQLNQLRSALPGTDEMKLDLDHSRLHKGKGIIDGKGINFSYDGKNLWKQPIDCRIDSGERIAIKGDNGSGKTTFVKMILGRLQPNTGTIASANVPIIYIDQDYSLIDNALTVYGQAQQYNSGFLQEHEIKMRLNRFLFTPEYWDKPCLVLSGGEKMRLLLCCLTIGNQAPDVMILDEPTNNLDLQNIAIFNRCRKTVSGHAYRYFPRCCFFKRDWHH